MNFDDLVSLAVRATVFSCDARSTPSVVTVVGCGTCEAMLCCLNGAILEPRSEELSDMRDTTGKETARTELNLRISELMTLPQWIHDRVLNSGRKIQPEKSHQTKDLSSQLGETCGFISDCGSSLHSNTATPSALASAAHNDRSPTPTRNPSQLLFSLMVSPTEHLNKHETKILLRFLPLTHKACL